jgi:nucleoside-diphosphate-sugar epimerase
MRFLVTGGAGFIGSHLVERLVAAGQDVVILDDLSSGRRANFAAVRRRVSFIRGNVTDLRSCRRAVEGADYVLHQAALTSVQRSVDDPLAAHEVNATGTLNILLAARDARVRRVVYAGSTSAYGNPCDAAELRGSRHATPLALRRVQARRRGVLRRVPRDLRTRNRRAAVLQRLRATPGSGLAVRGRRAAVHRRSPGR